MEFYQSLQELKDLQELQEEVNRHVESELDYVTSNYDEYFRKDLIELELSDAIHMAKDAVIRRFLGDIQGTHYRPDSELYNPTKTELLIRVCIESYDFASFIRRVREHEAVEESKLKHVRISWKFKDSPNHYEQEFDGHKSIDEYIEVWIDRYTDDWDCVNPMDYCDFFDIKLIN